tara:strand:- start:54 stop:563 length:510 start_codon:yes stop_codon:yes gene_type:complete
MKDVFDVKRSADSDDVLKCLNGQFYKVATLSAAAETIEDVQSGTLFIVDTAATGAKLVISLPACAAGLHYRFFMKADGSQAVDWDAKAVTSGTNDDFLGVIRDMETGTEAEVAFNGSSHNQITFDTNYNAGDYVEIVGTDANQWLIIPSSVSGDIAGIAAANSSANTAE